MSYLEEFDILDTLPFGKHVGELVGSIIETEPRYILWMINNTDLRLNEQTQRYLLENLRSV